MARRRRTRADEQRFGQMVQALRLMNFAFNSVRLYPPTHSEVVGVMTRLQETITAVLEEAEDVGFGFMDELLYIEGAMSIEETANNQMLVDRFARCRVKYLTVMKGVTKEDFLTFFQMLNAEATKPSTEHPSELLDKKGVHTIHIVEADVDDVASKSQFGLKKKTLLDWYSKAVGILESSRSEFMSGGQPDLHPLYRLVEDMMVTIRNKGYEPYLLLPLLSRGLDPHLAHSVNTAVLAAVLGEAYGLNSGQIQTLCTFAFLHDLGRLIIPADWVMDPSPLSAADRETARQHADWSYLLLTRHAELPVQAGLAGALHHLRSFPKGGFEPDVIHKLLALADDYDLALFGDKYYWRQHPKDRILRSLLRGRAQRHDAALVKLLSGRVGFYPPGTLVRLEDGQRGLVVRPNPMHPARPRVCLLDATAPKPTDVDGYTTLPMPAPGSAAEEPAPAIVDLSDLGEGGLGFRNSVAAVLPTDRSGEVWAFVDRKKEYLLSFSL